MWLHNPLTQSQSVQDTVESNLDSGKLSLLERSVTWKSNFQSQQSWLRVWKREPSMRLLSGLTSEPLIQNRGAEKWISSLEGSLVSPSQSQGRSSEKTIPEISGQTQPDLLGGLGFQSSFLKMCQESSDTTTKPYDPNYERWVTRLRKDYFQRQKQAHLTSVSESLSWRTPANQEPGISVDRLEGQLGARMYDKETGRLAQYGLIQQAQIEQHWRTPAASDPEGGVEDWSSDHFQNTDAPKIKLRDQAAIWPTPRSSNPGSSNEGYGAVLNEEAKNWPTPTTQETPHEEIAFTETGRRKTKDGNNSHSLNLQDVSANWPTPNTLDHVAPRSEEGNQKLFEGQRKGRTAPSNLREFVQPEMHPKNWPTPKVNDMEQDPEKARERMRKREEQNLTTGGIRNLTSEAKNWPIPTATERSGTNPNTGHGEGLNKTTKMWDEKEDKWPTPMQRDYKGFDGPGKKNALKPRELYLSTLQDQETEKHGQDSLQDSQNLNQPFAKKGICSPKCRRLNPNFAEHLMGLPAGWTSVSEPLEMGLYRLWQDALSENLQENLN